MLEMMKMRFNQIAEAKKLLGTRWFVKQLLGIFVGILLAPIVILVFGIVVICKVLNGTARVFHGAKIDGERVGWYTVPMKLLHAHPFVVQTDEGPVAMAHGAPNGKILIDPDTHWRVSIDQVSMAPAFCNLVGTVHFVSCYNGCREDWGDSTVQFVRVDVTKKAYSSIGISCPLFGGLLIVFSEKWCENLIP